MKVIVCAAILASGFAGPVLAETSWYASREDGHWCRYPTEKAWMASKGNESATVDRRKDRIVAIHINESDDGGDWTANDAYGVGESALIALERRYTTFDYGEVALAESWRRDGNHWVRTQRRLTDISGDHVRKDNPDVVYPFEKVERLADFGFAKLIGGEVKATICL